MRTTDAFRCIFERCPGVMRMDNRGVVRCGDCEREMPEGPHAVDFLLTFPTLGHSHD